ncbi:MAG TPA: hypothetical protein DCS43_02205 [Verrucomicrobia bacterium]|nr:hypothetical protein [Verrucomicrobiota bacterium]
MKYERMTKAAMVGIAMVGAGLLAQNGGAAPAPVTSKYDVSLYGYIKLDAAYDSQRTFAGNLMYYVLPEGKDGGQDEFNMTAKESRFGMTLTAPPIDDYKISGKIETDFYGGGATENSPALRLRLAYADVENGHWMLRAGQDWDTFVNLLPRTINFTSLADAGALGLRRPQVRLTHTLPLGEKTKLVSKLAAARTIGQDLDGAGQDDGAAAAYPTVQGNVSVETPGIAGRPMMIGISGHAGSETMAAYAATEGGSEVPEADYDTWSVIGTMGMPLSKALTLQGSVWTGENLDTYFGGIGQGINKTLRRSISASGGWLQLMLDVTAKLNLNVGYGLDSPDSVDLNAGDRAKNELVFTSLYYHLNSAVVLACEYSNMTTDYMANADATADRVQGSLIFKF